MDVEEILTALQSVGASDYPPFLSGTLRELRLASANSFMKNDRATDNTTSTDRQPSREEAIALLKGCVYRKPRPGRSGDEVRQGSGLT